MKETWKKVSVFALGFACGLIPTCIGYIREIKKHKKRIKEIDRQTQEFDEIKESFKKMIS